MTYLGAQLCNRLFNVHQVHCLDVAHDRRDEALLGGDGDADIDVVPVDNGIAAVVSLDRGVDGWDVAHGQDTGAGEGAHEAQLDTRLLEHVVLVF